MKLPPEVKLSLRVVGHITFQSTQSSLIWLYFLVVLLSECRFSKGLSLHEQILSSRNNKATENKSFSTRDTRPLHNVNPHRFLKDHKLLLKQTYSKGEAWLLTEWTQHQLNFALSIRQTESSCSFSWFGCPVTTLKLKTALAKSVTYDPSQQKQWSSRTEGITVHQQEASRAGVTANWSPAPHLDGSSRAGRSSNTASFSQALILNQYFLLHCTVRFMFAVKTSVSVFSFHTEWKRILTCYWREWRSNQGFWWFQSQHKQGLGALLSVQRSLTGLTVGGRRPAFGTRPKKNPIWHSHKEGAKVCNRCEGHWHRPWGPV